MPNDLHGEHGDVTERVRTARQSMSLPATKLEEALAEHAEKHQLVRKELQETSRAARTRSLSPGTLPKPR